MTISKREQILTALSAFIRQKPGLEPGNYSDWKSYRSEMRSIIRDKHIAEKLLAQVSWRESIGETELREAFRAYSRRLSLVDRPDGSIELDYCTGQYFPTEYRKAVCAVLASALWDYFRANMPAPSGKVKRTVGKGPFAIASEHDSINGMTPGDYLRATARKELGASIARAYFS